MISDKLTIGNYIKKKNFTAFGDKLPCIRVRSCGSTSKEGIFIVNNEFLIDPKYITVISEEESDKLIEYWNSLVVSENSNVNREFECIREDTKQPKECINPHNVRKLLFNYQQKFNKPELQVYKCSTCNKLHLGKNITFLIGGSEVVPDQES